MMTSHAISGNWRLSDENVADITRMYLTLIVCLSNALYRYIAIAT